MPKKMIPSLILVLLCCGLLSPASSHAAEKTGKPLLIGVLLYSKNNLQALAGFKAGLEERGYVEGQDVEYVFNGVVERKEDMGVAMSRVMARKPDLVYAAPTLAAHVAKKACLQKGIPVLFGPANNAVKSGLVKSLTHPGENITGVMLSNNEAKLLQWSMEIAPQIRNVLVPYNPKDKSALVSLKIASQGAARLGLQVISRQVHNHGEIDALIAKWPAGVDSVYLPRDGMVMSRIKDFAELAISKKIMLSTGTRITYVEKGALFCYGFDDIELGKQVARLADQIFRGKSPGDLPVESAEDYLALNLKTAKAIGVSVDKHILGLAHRVIRPE